VVEKEDLERPVSGNVKNVRPTKGERVSRTRLKENTGGKGGRSIRQWGVAR